MTLLDTKCHKMLIYFQKKGKIWHLKNMKLQDIFGNQSKKIY